MDTEEQEYEAVEEQPTAWQQLTPVQSSTHYWMKSGERSFARSFGQLLSKCGIIASEWSALRQLYGPQWRSPVELGRMIGLSKGGASKLVSRLVAKGLVDKKTHRSDRRFRSVGLTRSGKNLVEFLAPLEKDCNRQFFSPLGDGRSFRLRQWLKLVLASRPNARLDQWVEKQKEKAFPRADMNATAEAAAKAAAEAEEFWRKCILAGQKAAEEMFGSG